VILCGYSLLAEIDNDGFSSLAVAFWRGKQFMYAGKLECSRHNEQRLAMCEQFIGMTVAGPPFASVPERERGDTRSAGMSLARSRGSGPKSQSRFASGIDESSFFKAECVATG
jgi:hypothetical protein